MTNDKCRAEFEAWYDGNLEPSPHSDERYRFAETNEAYRIWYAACHAPRPPVSRDGWMTEEEIDRLVEINNHYEPGTDEVAALCNMARAAIRMYAERAALFVQLKAAIETVERGNV